MAESYPGPDRRRRMVSAAAALILVAAATAGCEGDTTATAGTYRYGYSPDDPMLVVRQGAVATCNVPGKDPVDLVISERHEVEKYRIVGQREGFLGSGEFVPTGYEVHPERLSYGIENCSRFVLLEPEDIENLAEVGKHFFGTNE